MRLRLRGCSAGDGTAGEGDAWSTMNPFCQASERRSQMEQNPKVAQRLFCLEDQT